jgi:hypothetical protein
MKKQLILAGAILTTTAVLQAQTIIGDFESSSLDGWSSGNSTLTFDTVGVTLGSSSLKLVAPGNWNTVLSRDVTSFISLLSQAGTTISLDITARNDDNSVPSWWLGNEIILNSDTTGWVGLGGQGTGVGWGPQTTHETYSISAGTAALLASATSAQLILVNNTGGNGATIYLDNIAITSVPEPAAACLLGVGVASLLIFRRRQA